MPEESNIVTIKVSIPGNLDFDQWVFHKSMNEQIVENDIRGQYRVWERLETRDRPDGIEVVFRVDPNTRIII